MKQTQASTPRVAKTFKLFIGGEFPRSESGRSFAVYRHENNHDIFANLCQASRKDFRNAITAAQNAGSSWATRSAYNRAQVLYRMAEMAEGKRTEFIEVLTDTIGLSHEDADREVTQAIDALVYYAGYADKYQQVTSSVNPVAGPHHSFTSAEPVGLVAALFDETTSLSEITASLAAILATGNSVVALLTGAVSAVIAPLAEVFATSDLPKGVANLLSGFSSELLEQFGAHMEVQAVLYHGSSADDLKRLRSLGVENLKRVHTKPKNARGLEHLLNFVEFKTVWHPMGH